MKTPRVLPLALVLAGFMACTCMAQTAQPPLKLEVAEGLPIVDGVYLNGQGPYRFLLDTGEQSNEMDPGLARQLGLVPTFQLELDTPAGASVVPGAMVHSVSIGLAGSAEAAEQEFLITRREVLHRLGPDIRGSLGQMFLAHFDYMLDLGRHRIEIFRTPPAGPRVPFRLVDGCMVISTSQGALTLDSGSNVLFLFRGSPHYENANVNTSNANMAAVVDRAPTLRIGSRQYSPSSAAFHPVASAPTDGLLPASLFRSIFVSNSEHYVVFDPR